MTQAGGVWNGLSGNLRGALILALSALVLTGETVLLRYMSSEVPVAVYTLARALAQLGLGALLVLSLGQGWRGARTQRIGLQLFRGVSSLVSWQLYYFSFRVLDFAIATTLNFTTALYVALLAGPIMKERVGPWRWAATALGFVGVLLVVRPGAAGSAIGLIAGLGSALCGVAIVFSNRSLGLSDRAETTMFWVGVVTTLGALPPAIAAWRLPAAGDALLVAGGATIGAAGLWLILIAYRLGEASALAPIPYLRLVFAALAGWALFAERPDAWTIAGCATIAASAILLARAESRKPR
ncbi:MAG: DMT family transporter [Alphaproteobacteria bacterium]|nr:DMT family transporter [Alphaproteobacteria bacterium]